MEAIKNQWTSTRWYRILTTVVFLSLVAFIVSNYYLRSTSHFFSSILYQGLFCWLVGTFVMIVRLLKEERLSSPSKNVTTTSTEFRSTLKNFSTVIILGLSWLFFLIFLFIMGSLASTDPANHFFEKTLLTFIIPFCIMGIATYKTFVKEDIKVILNGSPVAFLVLMVEIMVLGFVGIMPTAFILLTVIATISSFSYSLFRS